MPCSSGSFGKTQTFRARCSLTFFPGTRSELVIALNPKKSFGGAWIRQAAESRSTVIRAPSCVPMQVKQYGRSPKTTKKKKTKSARRSKMNRPPDPPTCFVVRHQGGTFFDRIASDGRFRLEFHYGHHFQYIRPRTRQRAGRDGLPKRNPGLPWSPRTKARMTADHREIIGTHAAESAHHRGHPSDGRARRQSLGGHIRALTASSVTALALEHGQG